MGLCCALPYFFDIAGSPKGLITLLSLCFTKDLVNQNEPTQVYQVLILKYKDSRLVLDRQREAA